MATERALRVVPRPVLGLLLAAFLAQLAWHGWSQGPVARAQRLPPVPSVAVLRVTSLGDPVALAKVLMLWLQAFDDQPGVSIPFRDLDYARVIDWLGRILSLDPRGQYPLLAASRLYGDIPDPAKERQMFEFVYREFFKDPDRRWPWLAQAVLMARHRLHDPRLALKYARALREKATGPNVPDWAKQMQIFVLADMGEVQSAKVLLGGLLASGTIKDPHELAFLKGRLKQLEKRLAEQRRKNNGPAPNPAGR